jgi:hypothetical protein
MKFLSLALLAFSLSAQAAPTVLKVEGIQDFSTNFYAAFHPVIKDGKNLGNASAFIRFYNMSDDRKRGQIPELYFAIGVRDGLNVLVDSGIKQEASQISATAGASSCAALEKSYDAGKLLLTELSRDSNGLRLDYYLVDIGGQAIRNAIEKSVCDVDASPRASIKEFIPTAEPFFSQKFQD